MIALGCAADLLKENEAKKIAANNSEFIPTLLNALKVRLLPSPSCPGLPWKPIALKAWPKDIEHRVQLTSPASAAQHSRCQ